MPNYTKEQLLEKYRALPKEVQEAIFSVNTAEIIRQIGEKHKLMIDKIGELADETGLVMLGLGHPNQFISHLTERLEINRELAKEIAEEVNSKIFFPIREHLKKMYGIEEKIEEKPSPMPPPPTSFPAPPISPTLETPEIKKEPPAIPTPPMPQFRQSIFEEKTKEQPFRSPLDISEKTALLPPEPPPQQTAKKPDPYKEPMI